MVTVGRTLVALLLAVGTLVFGVPPAVRLPAADAATVVATSHCRGLDPNLVHGACLRYRSTSGTTAYTWIGTYRAANGRVFFCIDYLYDSRISGRPTITSTQGLVNQLGRKVGDAEVAALNYIVSTWAARGSTGSDTRDAAIALIIRELMSDGVRPDGTVVYPRGLKVGERVRPPIGGLGGPIMSQAQEMWSAGSRYRGGYRLTLTTTDRGPIELGTSRRYAVAVLSATGRRVPGVQVRFSCTGPVVCPPAATTSTAPTPIAVKPRDVGDFGITASATGPASDGRIYRVGGWRTHGGGTARDHGIQRGWIAGRSTMNARVRASAQIVKGTPEIATTASHATAAPGTALHDLVTVAQLPASYRQQATANLYGPFAEQPGVASCTTDKLAGSVRFTVERNGQVRTPSITVTRPGYYVWSESLPGDIRTNAVTTPCGVVEETTRVIARTPTVRTQASTQRAVVGHAVHDTVVVGGLVGTDQVTVRWSLRGPLAPRGGSCDGLDWSNAGVLARGEFVARGNSTYRTAPTVLRVPGCVTYSEELEASDTTLPAQSPPGLPPETLLVTRPVTPIVPEIPSGPVVPGRGGRS